MGSNLGLVDPAPRAGGDFSDHGNADGDETDAQSKAKCMYQGLTRPPRTATKVCPERPIQKAFPNSRRVNLNSRVRLDLFSQVRHVQRRLA